MSRMDDLRRAATPLDRFLGASVGEDRNGNPVTVLSTFARLGLDPWEEAVSLANQSPDSARLRLGSLLGRFRDVPGSSSGFTVQRLLDQLPEKASPVVGRGAGPSLLRQAFGLGELLAIGALLLVVLQSVFVGLGGSGN